MASSEPLRVGSIRDAPARPAEASRADLVTPLVRRGVLLLAAPSYCCFPCALRSPDSFL